MKPYTYWIKRAFELENSNFIKSEETIKKLNASYLRIAKNLREEINKIQDKIDNTNIIFLDDVQAYKYRQKLLNDLKNKIYDEYRNLSQEEINVTTKHYKDVIENTYKNMSDYLGSIKADASFSMLKTDFIQDLLSIKWLGENYSDRVWKNTNLLAKKMEDILLDGIVSGKSIDFMAKQINKMMRVGSFNCERLIRTETNFFHNRTSLKAYKDYGIEKYEFLATIDSRTSTICSKLNGQIFNIDKAKTGVNYPPMHPFCRSTTVAYFEEEQLQQDEKDSIIKEWKGIQNNSNYNKKEAISILKNKYGIDFKDSRKYPIDESILNECVSWLDAFNDAYSNFMKVNPCKIPIIANYPDSKMKNSVGYYSYYSNNNKVVELALNAKYHSDKDYFKQYLDYVKGNHSVANAELIHTFVHEYGHHISNSMRWISNNYNWQSEFISECIKEYNDKYNTSYTSYREFRNIVSIYGASAESELFAETFAEFFGGKSPREFAIIFGNKLNKVLKELN